MRLDSNNVPLNFGEKWKIIQGFLENIYYSDKMGENCQNFDYIDIKNVF